jgi:hypothetical protein
MRRFAEENESGVANALEHRIEILRIAQRLRPASQLARERLVPAASRLTS